MFCSECGRDLPDGPPCPHCVGTIGDSGGVPPEREEETATYDNEPTRTEQFLPGAMFAGRYRIVHRLGKGGMGEVYRAEDVRLGQTIALKFLYRSAHNDALAPERFRDEARLARRVNHPGVCRIFDFGRAEGMTYVAMEHVEGETLRSLRRRIGHPPPERALEIALEICQGLGAIHEQGILHRDLKPANVMLDGQGRARILDFGLAAIADAVSGADVRSGTPAYMAPEQARGEGVSVRSDLYSLGLILRELWTGKRLRKSDRHDPPPISSIVDGVAPAVDRIVSRCLRVDPERRPTSAESVLAGLQQAAAFEPGPVLRTVIAFDPLSLTTENSENIADLLESFGGQEVWDTDGSLWLFERPRDAVSFAVAYRDQAERDDHIRFAMEVTEVVLRARRTGEPGSAALALEGTAAPMARALVALARPGQTLLSGLASHLARKAGRSVDGGELLSWLSHGRYRLSGNEDPVEVFEVGVEGRAPLEAPASSEAGQLALDSRMVTGWRPAPGVGIPQRPNFRIERRAGEGGFGEVWLARHRKTGERRVFKFCFDASRLRGLRREITLFRLLKEELGDRDDIARVLDWNLDQAPFFIESEYTADGDLKEWLESQGGTDKVPLEERLEIVAQVAEALAAAHSVGVLHKDIKPGNVLITVDPHGGFRARLSDFGVGLVTDKERLEAAGITIAGWTTLSSDESGNSASGTRLYMAPEVLEGSPPTLQADVYALGVVLYQLVVGHLGRAVAPGWRKAIDDQLLVEDIAAALHGDPAGRIQSARELATRLRSLGVRRKAARRKALRRQEEDERKLQLKQAARRRRLYRSGVVFGLMLLVTMGLLTGFLLYDRGKEALTIGLLLLVVMGSLTCWAFNEREKEVKARQQEIEARREFQQMTDFVMNLFDIADPYSTQGAEIVVSEISAVELLKRGVDRLETAFEDEPQIRARLLNKLGITFQGLGNPEQAKKLLERGLKIRLDIFGPNHLEVAESLTTLGCLGSSSAGFESENQLRKALEIRRRYLPADHLDIADSLNHIGAALLYQGIYAEAEHYVRESLAMNHRLLGEDHPEVAKGINNLALVLNFQGRPTEAEKLLRRSLAMYCQIVGDEHAAVIRVQVNLASTLKAQGSYVEAEEFYRKSLALLCRIFGDQHPEVAGILNNLAAVLQARGSYQEATSLFQESIAMHRRLLGSEHHFVAIGLSHLAAVLEIQGFYAEAERKIRESFKILRKVHSPNHWLIAYSESVEAAIWIARGELAKAEPVLLSSYPAIEAIRGSNSDYTRYVLKRLVDLYKAWGKPTEANRYRSLWIEAGGRPESN